MTAPIEADPVINPDDGSREPDPVTWRWRGLSELAEVRLAATAAREFLTGRGLQPEEVSAWELVITEAANNCVIHGAAVPLPWDLEFSVTASEVRAVLTDRTAGFDWPETVELPEPEAESGRGIFLITTLTDSRNYTRGARENVLTLIRHRIPAAPKPAALAAAVPPVLQDISSSAPPDGGPDAPSYVSTNEALELTLDSMTEELSSAYESLSAIFRFSAGSRVLTEITVFAQQLLEHLTTVTRADCGVVRLAAIDGGPPVTLAALGCLPPGEELPGESFISFESAAQQSRQDQWIDNLTFPDNRPGILSGLVHPFYDGDHLMGMLSIGRRTVREPLRAGEVNVIHTFSEFLAQQILRRRHEEAALRASVVKRELELAAAIQRSLLPFSMPLIPGLEMSAHCESAMDVGGDFYGVLPWGGSGVFFMMADVMGKGVGASMMAAVTRSVLRSLPGFYENPGLVLRQTAKFLYEDLDQLGMFVTAVVGTVDPGTGLVRVANAGHCPVLLAVPGGEIHEIAASGPPLGVVEEIDYPSVEMAFPPGAMMLVFTDGLTDPRDGRGAFASHTELAEWMQKLPPGVDSAQHLHKALLDRLHRQSATAALADDQTFLIFHRPLPTTFS